MVPPTKTPRLRSRLFFFKRRLISLRNSRRITEKPEDRRETKSDGFAFRYGDAPEAPGRNDIEIFDFIRSIVPFIECTGIGGDRQRCRVH